MGVVFEEAADLERPRFEIREPRLEFQEWIDAGMPAVHTVELTGAITGSSDLPTAG